MPVHWRGGGLLAKTERAAGLIGLLSKPDNTVTKQVNQLHRQRVVDAPAARTSPSKLQRARYGNWTVWALVIPPFGFAWFLFMLWPAPYLPRLSTAQVGRAGTDQFVAWTISPMCLAIDRFWLSLQHNIICPSLRWILHPSSGWHSRFCLHAGARRAIHSFRSFTFCRTWFLSAIIAVIWRWIIDPNDGPANALLHSIGLGFLRDTVAGRQQPGAPALFIRAPGVASGFSMLIFQAAIRLIDESYAKRRGLTARTGGMRCAISLYPASGKR